MQNLKHFWQHQRDARFRSYLLLLVMVLGVLLCTFLYNGLFYYILSMKADKKPLSFWYMLPVSFFILGFIVLSGYLEERERLLSRFASENAEKLGAVPFPENMTNSAGFFVFRQFKNVVQEISLASGVDAPMLYYLPNEQRVNAFVIGGFADSVVLAVSQGALNCLTRDELQMLVAHEFGHLENDDIAFRRELSAVIYGFNHMIENSISSIRFSFVVLLFCLMQFLAGCLLLLYGKLIQAAFSRQREWLADAYAIQYTRNADALISLLTKAELSTNLNKKDKAKNKIVARYREKFTKSEYHHLFFVNYWDKWLSSHPSVMARISRYGIVPTYGERLALSYKMDEQILRRQNLLNQPIQVNRMTEFSLLPDDEYPTSKKSDDEAKKAAEAAAAEAEAEAAAQKKPQKPVFLYQKAYPLKIVEEYTKAQLEHIKTGIPKNKNTAMVFVLAEFTLLAEEDPEKLAERFNWPESLQTAVKRALEDLEKSHALTHIVTFLYYADVFHQEKIPAGLLNQISELMASRGRASFLEICYWLCLRHLAVPKEGEPLAFKDAKAPMSVVIAEAARLVSKEREAQEKFYRLVYEEVFYETLDPNKGVGISEKLQEPDAFYHAVLATKNLPRAYRDSFYKSLEKFIIFDEQLTAEQNVLLKMLALLYFDRITQPV